MNNSIYNKLVNEEATLAVIGLGYVGLPIALEFARKIKVVGFDINQDRVDLMKKNIDPSNELEASDFENRNIQFTADINDLADVQFFVVAVPTPIDDSNLPNLTPLLSASRTVGKVLKKGDYSNLLQRLFFDVTQEEKTQLNFSDSLLFPSDASQEKVFEKLKKVACLLQ
mgnify:CR=1 FL=1